MTECQVARYRSEIARQQLGQHLVEGQRAVEDSSDGAPQNRDGECLVKEEEWSGSADLVLQKIKEDFGPKAGFLSLAPGEVRAEGLQLTAGAQVVARQCHVVARRFVIPLHLTPRGGSELKMYGWEWGRVTNRYEEPMDARPFLEQFTELDVAPLTGLNGKRIRKHLDEALDDPSVPGTDGAFGLVKDFYESLPRKDMEAADVRRLARLIKDSRVTSLEFPDYKLEPDQLLQLKDPILARLLLLAAANEWPVYYQLQMRLKRMPEGAFRRPDSRVESLLSSADGLLNSPALVSRLADRRPRESKRLFHTCGKAMRLPEKIALAILNLCKPHCADCANWDRKLSPL